MAVWDFLANQIEKGHSTILLYVLESKGSSPGRKGFIMAISQSGKFVGTIGGGIMEVKMLELAKNKLTKNDKSITTKTQYHDKKHKKERSGLICSGEQTIALIPLNANNLEDIKKIANHRNGKLHISINNHQFKILEKTAHQKEKTITLENHKKIHIFGAGHVGLALSQVMSLLNYQIILYDNRPELNTIKQNKFANEIIIVDYENIVSYLTVSKTDCAVIVTSSFVSDKSILRQLYQQPFRYLGMMGSESKVAILYEELEVQGIDKEKLKHVFSPIGLNVYSKTAMEIAISIASEIILQTNKDLPTGRSKSKL